MAGVIFLWRALRAERGRVAAVREEQRDRDAAIEAMIANLTENIVPAIGAAVRRSDPDNPTVNLPIVLEQSRIAELVWQWTARCGEELQQVATETADRIRREGATETQLALAQAESARDTAIAQVEEMAQLAIAQSEEAARVAVAQAGESARTAVAEAAEGAR
ncbi:hypothetical protein ACFROC_17500, partial [Nocardia tengchongensis]